MSIEQIIDNRVNQFIQRYSSHRFGRLKIEDFKDAVESQLEDFDENHEKLLLLHRLKSHFNKDYIDHLETCKHKDDPMKCLNNRMYNEVEFYFTKAIKNINPRLKIEDSRFSLNSKLVHDVICNFNKYPKSAKLYQQAIDKVKHGNLDRNCLDDIRLSLEILLKELLGNNKSIENQFSELGEFLKNNGCSKETRNLIITTLNIYSKHNNQYVKHNDGVHEREVGFIINLTAAAINFLLEF